MKIEDTKIKIEDRIYRTYLFEMPKWHLKNQGWR